MYIPEMIWYGLAHQICFMMDLHSWDHLLGDCLTLDGCWLSILLLGAAIFLRVWWKPFMMAIWRPYWLDNIYCKSRCSPTFILEVWIQVNFKFSFKTRRTIRNISPWSWLYSVTTHFAWVPTHRKMNFGCPLLRKGNFGLPSTRE